MMYLSLKCLPEISWVDGMDPGLAAMFQGREFEKKLYPEDCGLTQQSIDKFIT